ncbi:hypothetical protein [Zavarzinia sp. CC-PAN008]|uniref:hypothetical protein n=1 Tax=Zavarzinia sp. CC-PAN008 TaxID=3243332 RepID=UPI003F749367
MTPDDTAASVTAFYRAYVGAFNAGDMARYIGCFWPPVALVTSAAGVQVLTDMQAAADGLKQRFASLDWKRTEIVALKVWPLEADLALIASDLDRLRGDGTAFERLRYLYTARRRPDDPLGWGIVSVTELPAALPPSDPLVGR